MPLAPVIDLDHRRLARDLRHLGFDPGADLFARCDLFELNELKQAVLRAFMGCPERGDGYLLGSIAGTRQLRSRRPVSPLAALTGGEAA